MGTEDARKLFVAGLPDGMTEEALRNLFTDVGARVDDLSMPRDRATGKSRGFAFVTLATAEQANAARGTLDGFIVQGRSVRVRPFSSEPPARGERRDDGPPRPGGAPGGGPPRRRDDSDRTLYVGNLPYGATEADVRRLFVSAGSVEPERVHLPAGQDGRPRGFGFAALPSAEEAQKAVGLLQNADLGGRRLMIHMAQPKGERPPRPPGGPGMSREGGEGGPVGSVDPGEAWRVMNAAETPGRSRARKWEEVKTEGKPKPKKRKKGGRNWDDDDWERE